MHAKRRTALRLAALMTALSLVGCADESQRSAGPAQAPSSSAVAPGPTSAATVEVDVKRVWATYRDAALAQDGDLAVSQLSTQTLASYGRFRDDALSLSADELAGRDPSAQLSIMVLRAKVDRDELRSLSDEQVLARAFDEGLIDESTYITTDLVEVTASGETALGDVVYDGVRLDGAFLFRREGDAWKLDLGEALDRADAGFVALAEREGVTVEELVDRLVETSYGVGDASRLREPLDG